MVWTPSVVYRARWLPSQRRKMTGKCRLGRLAWPMGARQAKRSLMSVFREDCGAGCEQAAEGSGGAAGLGTKNRPPSSSPAERTWLKCWQSTVLRRRRSLRRWSRSATLGRTKNPGYADRIDACKLLTQLYGVLKATTVFGWSAASAQWACLMKRRG